MNKAERQRQLIRLLTLRRSDTMSNLAVELGVSRHTIMRDLAELCEELPTITERGPRGGVGVMPGWEMPHGHLTAEQVNLLKSLMSRANPEEKVGLLGILKDFAPKKGEQYE